MHLSLSPLARRLLIFIVLGLYFIFSYPEIRYVGPFASINSGAHILVPTATSVDLSVLVTPPTLQANSQTTVNLTGLSYTWDQAEQPQMPTTLCIDLITLVSPTNEGALYFDGFEAEYPLCFQLPPPDTTIFKEFNKASWHFAIEQHLPKGVTVSSTLFQDGERFWYPYDNTAFRFTTEVYYRLLQNETLLSNQMTIVPPTTTVASISDWHSTATVSMLPATPFIQQYNPELTRVVSIGLQRPLLLQVVYPLLCATMLLFILLLTDVSSTEAMIEGGVATLFGLFGLRQILLPANTEIRTLMDVTIWGLYLAFATTLIPYLLPKRKLPELPVAPPFTPRHPQQDQEATVTFPIVQEVPTSLLATFAVVMVAIAIFLARAKRR